MCNYLHIIIWICTRNRHFGYIFGSSPNHHISLHTFYFSIKMEKQDSIILCNFQISTNIWWKYSCQLVPLSVVPNIEITDIRIINIISVFLSYNSTSQTYFSISKFGSMLPFDRTFCIKSLHCFAVITFLL